MSTKECPSVRARYMRASTTLAASDALAREIDALRVASASSASAVGRETRTHRAGRMMMKMDDDDDDDVGIRRELSRREAFWRETCEAQARDLRALAASASSRAEAAMRAAAEATRTAAEATRERDALRMALEAAMARERAVMRERDMMDAAAAMGDVARMRHAFAAWLRGAARSLRARLAFDKIEASARRRSLERAFERFRDGVRLSRIEREIERRANERRRREVLVNWSVCCEVSRAGERSHARRALIRWSRFVADEHERARVFKDAELAVRLTRERAVALLTRVRKGAQMRSAFASWIIFVANSRRARMVELELIERERDSAREAAIARVKARARGKEVSGLE